MDKYRYSVSIDKMVITAYDRGDMSDLINEMLPLFEEEQDKINKDTGEIYTKRYIRAVFGAKYPYRKSFICNDGSLIQWTDNKEMRDYRIEFNPNNCEMENIKRLLGRLKYPHVTRVDIAYDFPGIDINDYQIIDKNSRQQINYISGIGRLETKYIGATSSDMRLRIYDKEKERKAKGKETEGYGWRIESQLRKTWVEMINQKEKGVFPLPNPFQDIIIKKLKYDEVENVKEKAMLFYLENFPAEMQKLTKPTRLKYKKMLTNLKECEQLDVYSIFENDKEDILYNIHKLLKISKKNNVIDNNKSLSPYDFMNDDNIPFIDRPIEFTKEQWEKLSEKEQNKYKK